MSISKENSPMHPSGDQRFRILTATMKRYQYSAEALIEVLHQAQELFGDLELDLLLFIAHRLKLPPSRVNGVATFYNFCSLKHKGAHTCVVCMGTACYVKGAGNLLATLSQEYQVKAGETTANGQLSLIKARCLGECGIAPGVVVDGKIEGYQTPELVICRVEESLHYAS